MNVSTVVHRLSAAVTREPHRHEVNELLYVTAGNFTVQVEGGVLAAGPGDLLFYPAGASHRATMAHDGTIRMIVLQWREHARDRLPVRAVCLRDARGRLLASLMWMADLTPPRTTEEAEQRERLLDVVIGELRRLCFPEGAEMHDPIVRVQRWLHAEGTRRSSIRLVDMAAVAGMSVRQFSRAFADRAGETPAQYLQRLRVEAALPLITHGDLPFGEVAVRVGLCDASYLWRLVARHTGRSPQALRAAARRQTAAG